MDIQEIKATLGVARLGLDVATKADGTPATTIGADNKVTTWLRHWDNNKRVAISIAQDLYDEIKANPTGITNLALQAGTRTGSKGEYVTQRIIRYTPSAYEL